MRHAVSMTGCIDRTHERHRAIQLVKVLAGVRAIMGCHPVGHGEPGALRRDRSNVGGCMLPLVVDLIQCQRGGGSRDRRTPRK